jgi:hypothetical protein
MICPFTVGQRVVCINPVWIQINPQAENYGEHIKGPKVNQIYKITSVDVWGNYVYLKLTTFSEHMLWNSVCFRPLNERPAETSIEIFKKLLDPSRKVYAGKRPMIA